MSDRANLETTRLVEFPSGDAVLRGLLIDLEGAGRRPTVVMTHGYSASMTGMVADRYAEVLASAGLTVVLFDHRGFGLSGGEPRRVINEWTQVLEYRDALDYVATLPTVDATRLAVWGDSLSGAVALGVAAFDDRVRAVVVQVPACGSEPPPDDAVGTAFATLRDLYNRGGRETPPRKRIGPMAVVSPDQLTSPSLLEPITAFRWFIDYGARPGTGWQNWAIHEIPDLPVPFHPGLCTPHLHGPSMWVIADDDEMPGAEPDVAHRAFDAAPLPKELVVVDGGHFGLLYHPSAMFDTASAAQADFLRRHL